MIKTVSIANAMTITKTVTIAIAMTMTNTVTITNAMTMTKTMLVNKDARNSEATHLVYAPGHLVQMPCRPPRYQGCSA